MSNLDVLEVKWFLAVLAVERPLRALSLIMALLLVEADVFLAGGAGDDHELALPLVVQLPRGGVFKAGTQTMNGLVQDKAARLTSHLVLLNAAFPGAAFIDADGW